MVTATADSLAAEISRRLDNRLEMESNADLAVKNYQTAATLLKNALEQGLEELIEKGEHRGTYLCSLDINEVAVDFSLKGVNRVASLPSFKLALGDDTYNITPTINPLIGKIEYEVPNRSLSFSCETLPPRVHLLTNPKSGREFNAHRALEFVGMLLQGSK